MNKEQDIIMAKEILSQLGKYSCESNNSYDNEPALTYFATYKGYGFEIRSTFSSDYKYSNDQLKNKFEDIDISFCKKAYLSTKNIFYKPGAWEEVLSELYKKIPIIKKEQDNYKEEIDFIIRNIIIPYQNSYPYNKKNITTRLLKEKDIYLYEKELQIGDIETYDTRTYKKYTIFKGKNQVLNLDFYGFEYDYINNTSLSKIKTNLYKPGKWKYEIRDCIIKVNKELEPNRSKKITEEADKYLRRLRNKKY